MDFRNTFPRFNRENRRSNQALVDLLSKFAQQRKTTPAQLVLAWLLAKKPWIVPIPGTTKLHRLEENLGAANVDLTAEDLHTIESASSTIKVAGARYPQWVEQGDRTVAVTPLYPTGVLRQNPLEALPPC